MVSTAAFIILQPGKLLDLSALLKAKKYANQGNKERAVKAMRKLESDGLGKLVKKEMQHGASAVSCSVMHIIQSIFLMYFKLLLVHHAALDTVCTYVAKKFEQVRTTPIT